MCYTKDPHETFELSKAFIRFYFSQFYKKKSNMESAGGEHAVPALKDRVLNDVKIL